MITLSLLYLLYYQYYQKNPQKEQSLKKLECISSEPQSNWIKTLVLNKKVKLKINFTDVTIEEVEKMLTKRFHSKINKEGILSNKMCSKSRHSKVTN